MTAAIIDCETTGRVEPECIEVAWVWLAFGNPTRQEIGEGGRDIPTCYRFKPSKPIELGAIAAHGILDEDLAECDPSALYEAPDCTYWIGQNCDYDWEVAGKPPKPKRIDTCALARSVWPDLDCYSQSALIYHLDRPNARERLKAAHGAAADCLLCKTILDAIIAKLEVTSWADLWDRSEATRIPKTMPFGKWKGTPMKDVPADYKRWLLGQPDVDDYLRIALGGKPNDKRLL